MRHDGDYMWLVVEVMAPILRRIGQIAEHELSLGMTTFSCRAGLFVERCAPPLTADIRTIP